MLTRIRQLRTVHIWLARSRAILKSCKGRLQTVAGRVVSIRKFGKIAFVVIKDISGELQLFFKNDILAELDAANSQLRTCSTKFAR